MICKQADSVGEVAPARIWRKVICTYLSHQKTLQSELRRSTRATLQKSLPNSVSRGEKHVGMGCCTASTYTSVSGN